MSNAAFSLSAGSPILDRAFLRARLAAVRKRGARGDATTGMRLMEMGSLEPYEQAKHGQATWSTTTPYEKAPGAPGIVTPKIPAAVLVPLVEHDSGFTVLLTQRTADLKAHAGQIAFPGGRREQGEDANLNALRETEEEIGLAAAHIELLGHLDPYITVSGFEVTPVVGVVTPPFELRPDPVEVADIFEVPLGFFLDPANHQRHSRTVGEGVTRAYYAMPYNDRYIWGATAGMLVNLYEVLMGDS